MLMEFLNTNCNANSLQDAIEAAMSSAEVARFINSTSRSDLTIVPTVLSDYEETEAGQCHRNVCSAVEKGLGEHVWGWYLQSPEVHFTMGMYFLTHHSVLRTDDGLVNVTEGLGDKIIFIEDNTRRFDFVRKVGYNDRMLIPHDAAPWFPIAASVPFGKLLYHSRGKFSRDKYYEKYQLIETVEELEQLIPLGLSSEESTKWIVLKTNAYVS